MNNNCFLCEAFSERSDHLRRIVYVSVTVILMKVMHVCHCGRDIGGLMEG